MVTQITEITANPDLNAPSDFNNQMTLWVSQQRTTIAEHNTQAAEVNDLALRAEVAAGAIADTKWVSGSYTQGDVVWSPTDFYTYRAKNTGTLTTDPALDAGNWQLLTMTTNGGADVTSSAADVTLLSTANKVQNISMTADNKNVNLPAASLLDSGLVFIVINSGNYEFNIYNNSGLMLCVVPPSASVGLCLVDKGNDTWRVSNYSNINSVLSPKLLNRDFVNSSAVTSTFLAKLSDTKYIASYYQTSGTALYIVVFTTLSDGSIDTVGTPVEVTEQGSTNVHSIAAFDSTNAAVAYVDASNNTKIVAISISGTVPTLDASPATVATTTAPTMVNIIKVNSTKLSMCYGISTALYGKVITLSGGSVSAGTQDTLNGSVGSTIGLHELSQTLIDTNIVAIAYSASGGTRTILADVSTTTMTHGTAASISSSCVIKLPNNNLAIFSFNNSTKLISYSVYSYSSTTLTQVSNTRMLTYSAEGITFINAIKLSSQKIVIITGYGTLVAVASGNKINVISMNTHRVNGSYALPVETVDSKLLMAVINDTDSYCVVEEFGVPV